MPRRRGKDNHRLRFWYRETTDPFTPISAGFGAACRLSRHGALVPGVREDGAAVCALRRRAARRGAVRLLGFARAPPPVVGLLYSHGPPGWRPPERRSSPPAGGPPHPPPCARPPGRLPHRRPRR